MTRDAVLDELFDALAATPRRQLLVELFRNPDAAPITGRDLAGMNGSTDSDAVALQHVHLPKLDAYDVIEWDRHSGRISRGTRFEELEPILECLHEHDANSPVDLSHL